MTWSDRKLIIGTGNIYGKNDLIGYLDPDTLSDITSVTFDTFKNATGRWDFKVERSEGESL